MVIAGKQAIFRTAVASLLALTLCLTALPGQAADARTNYLLYCSGCHLVGGEGAPPNVPTLHQELGRMMQVPAMRSYLLRVPGAAHTPLDDAELAAVVNWILTEFNSDTLPADFQPISAEEARLARQHILADPLAYRRQHWQDYAP